jgi:hypothetical protein
MTGVILTGASGAEYFYTPYAFAATRWHADPANYAFAYPDESGEWQLAYIGETDSLFHRMRSHGRWPAAKRLGCAHVLVNLNAGGVAARRTEERDLVLCYQPPLNTQLLRPSRPRPARNGYY